jgi:hypothetical protein
VEKGGARIIIEVGKVDESNTRRGKKGEKGRIRRSIKWREDVRP